MSSRLTAPGFVLETGFENRKVEGKKKKRGVTLISHCARCCRQTPELKGPRVMGSELPQRSEGLVPSAFTKHTLGLGTAVSALAVTPLPGLP